MKSNDTGKLKTIFFASWLAIAILGFLLIRSAVENYRLKSALSFTKYNLSSLASDLDQARAEINSGEAQSANFLQWQYVLRDQVTTANKELRQRISQIKDIGKDRSLLNLLYYNLGLNYFMAVNFKEAINAFNEALKYDYNDAKSNYDLGLLYSAFMNDSAKALKYYKRYLELDPSGPKSGEIRDRVKVLEKK